VSGEKKSGTRPRSSLQGKYLISLAQVLSVLRLNVALTTCRSGIRKNHVHALLTLSHHNGDDGIESKRFPAKRQVDDTGESLTVEEKLARRTRKRKRKGGEE